MRESELKGKRVTVVGRSLVVGKPLAMLMLGQHATVTICHTRTADFTGTCRNAEILVAAAGKARMIKAEHVAEGLWSLMGINVDEDGSLCGDVDFDQVKTKAGVLTPVPGGMGSCYHTGAAKTPDSICKRKDWISHGGTCKTFLDAFGRNRHWYRRGGFTRCREPDCRLPFCLLWAFMPLC